MIVKLAVGIAVGALIGAFIGSARSCETGACPLTATPLRGSLWGGFLGLVLAFNLASGCSIGRGSSAGKATQAAAEISNSSMPEIASMEAFKEKVLANTSGKTLVDFYATWCGPCKQYGPILESLAEEKIPGVAFVKVNVDAARSIADAYGISAIPTTIIFENGKEIKRMMGLQSRDRVLSALGK